MNKKPDVYILSSNVYSSTGRQLPVKNQRGKKYVNYQGRQINIKRIPEIKPDWDLFAWYVLSGLFFSSPCRVMDWWMEMREKGTFINIKDSKITRKNNKTYLQNFYDTKTIFVPVARHDRIYMAGQTIQNHHPAEAACN